MSLRSSSPQHHAAKLSQTALPCNGSLTTRSAGPRGTAWGASNTRLHTDGHQTASQPRLRDRRWDGQASMRLHRQRQSRCALLAAHNRSLQTLEQKLAYKQASDCTNSHQEDSVQGSHTSSTLDNSACNQSHVDHFELTPRSMHPRRSVRAVVQRSSRSAISSNSRAILSHRRLPAPSAKLENWSSGGAVTTRLPGSCLSVAALREEAGLIGAYRVSRDGEGITDRPHPRTRRTPACSHVHSNDTSAVHPAVTERQKHCSFRDSVQGGTLDDSVTSIGATHTTQQIKERPDDSVANPNGANQAPELSTGDCAAEQVDAIPPKGGTGSCVDSCGNTCPEDDPERGEEDDEDFDDEEIPDGEVLRDQLEWDLGVAETIYTLKALQINEQIAMESRQKADFRRHANSKGTKSKALAACEQRRNSCIGASRDHLDAAGAGINRARMSCSDSCMPQNNRTSAIHARASAGMRVRDQMRVGGGPKGDSRFRIIHDEMRTRSQRALFEGLANTAEMSRDRWYIVRPWGQWRQAWVIAVSISACYAAISAPLVTCDVLDPSPALYLSEASCDVLFAIDVVLHFLTAYQDELRDIIVTSPRHIRQRYMSGWFAIDMIGAIPLDWLLRAIGRPEYANQARIVKLARVARVLLAGEWRMASVLGDTSVNPSLILAFKLTLSLLLAWHWSACAYNKLSVDAPPSEDPNNMYNTSVPWGSPAHILEGSSTNKYLHALSWAIGATVGTIRPEPNTRGQMIFSDTMTLFGFIAMAWVVGAATTAVADLQHERSELSQTLSRIARYMRRKHLPREIRLRVLSYYRFHQSSMNILEHEEVLVGLPRAMRMQISLLMHKPVFVQLPLFWLCTEEQILFIVQRLRPCIATPGEMLVKEGTIGIGLFLLMKGAVETTREGELLVVLLAVAAFGEKALQSDAVSDMSIRALRFCETSILLRPDWLVIERLNPQIQIWLDIYIQERDRRLQDPTVKAQSVQTKKATLRCGAGTAEWKSSTQTSSQRHSRVAINRAADLRSRARWQHTIDAFSTGNMRTAGKLLLTRMKTRMKTRPRAQVTAPTDGTRIARAASIASSVIGLFTSTGPQSQNEHPEEVRDTTNEFNGCMELRKRSIAAMPNCTCTHKGTEERTDSNSSSDLFPIPVKV